MLRKLALSLAIAGVLGVPNANALGLGEINIRSALNEPLSAEIRLMQVRDLSPLQIQPRMADADEFSIAGLSKSRFLNDVRFQVQIAPDGSGVIRMTSNEPVREPFLNFLVEVNWPNGRLVREYTVLLDPPVFDPAPVSGGQFQPAVTSIPTATTPISSPATTSSVAPAPRQPQTLPGEVRVGTNDTLWVLANRYRPDASVTTQQMMVALQRHNPNVFPTANINMMRAGTVMRIPSAEQIRALSPAEANAEVNRQTEEWRNRNRPAPVADTAPATPEVAAVEAPQAEIEEAQTEQSVDAESVAEDAAAEAEALAAAAEALAEAELRIVTPEEDLASEQASDIGDTAARDDADESAELTGALMQRSEQLDNRLIVLEEDLDRTRLENRDLKDSNDSLQEQLVLLQRMMELQSEQLAQLQTQMTESQPESNLTEKLTSLPIIGGAIAAFVALLVGLMLGRRKKKTPEPMFKAPDAASESTALGKGAVVATAATVAAAAAAEDDEKTSDEFDSDSVDLGLDTEESADDFSDLDLDLDLDLELNESDDEDSVRVVDEEYDLSADDDFADLLNDSELDLNAENTQEVAPVESESVAAEESLEVAEEPKSEAVESVAEEAHDSLDDLLGEDLPEPSSQVEPSVEEDDDFSSLDDLLMTDMDDSEEAFNSEDAPSSTEKADEGISDAADDLDFVLSEDTDNAEEDALENTSETQETSTADDDLDSLLSSLELEEDDVPVSSKLRPGEQVEEELTANIMHDLEMDLDDELDDLLNSTDDDIALEESQSADEAIDMLDGMNLLDGADENETKLDLARAYLEMDDSEGAREILAEILAEGNDQQKEEAQKLFDSLN